METPYQICLLGDYIPYQKRIFEILDARFKDYGFPIGSYKLFSGSDVYSRNKKAPTLAIFFGYKGVREYDHPELNELIEDSIIILPIVTDKASYQEFVPKSLYQINASEVALDESDFTKEINLLFENFGLLRTERRLFISYKCDDSQSIALQLYEELNRRQFDVFIDVRGVSPSSNFQSILMNKISDSDVVIVLDSPNFSVSPWTKEELEQADAVGVKILRVLWPGQILASNHLFSFPFELDYDNFLDGTYSGRNVTLDSIVITNIANKVESLRCRAVAERYQNIVNSFCDFVKELEYKTVIQPSYNIVITKNELQSVVVPIIGIPNAERLHYIYSKNKLDNQENLITLYDSTKLNSTTTKHLNWLNNFLPILTFGTKEQSELINWIEK